MQSEIITRIYGGGYAHAENVLLRLQELERNLSADEVIRKLHREVFTGPEVCYGCTHPPREGNAG